MLHVLRCAKKITTDQQLVL